MIELNGRLSLSTFVIIVAALTTAIVEVVFLSAAPRRTLRIISQIPFRLRSYNPILEMIIPDTLPPGDVASGLARPFTFYLQLSRNVQCTEYVNR